MTDAQARGMQITLMRHGKPALASSGWVAPRDLGRWIADYDRSSIEIHAIPAGSIHAATNAAVIFTSTLPRAQASARALGHATPRSDALFDEAALPHALWRFPRLPPPVWAAIFRLLWLLGYTGGADALATVRLRANAASALLMAAAADGPVLLIGHGIMNRLIAQELEKAGWSATTTHGCGYWDSVAFQSP